MREDLVEDDADALVFDASDEEELVAAVQREQAPEVAPEVARPPQPLHSRSAEFGFAMANFAAIEARLSQQNLVHVETL